jgi:ABC-type transport system involved in multi-copper enzyme maturation permease subunit
MMISLSRDLYDTYLSFRFELTKHFKRKRLLIVGTLAILIPLLFLIKSPNLSSEFASNSLTLMNVLALISGAMFAGDAISSEFEKKTSLLVFPTPQRRVSIFAGKYLAALAATLMIVSIYYLVVTIEVIGLFGAGEIPMVLLKSYFLAALYASSVVSIIYFFSSIFKKTTMSTVVGFFFVLMVLPILSMIFMLLKVEPWFIVTYSAGLITNVIGVASIAASHAEGMGIEDFQPQLALGIVMMFVYTAVFFLAGTWIANRKSVE